MSPNYFAVLICVSLLGTVHGGIITSPPITDWGVWGEMEQCPNGTVVQGFQVKVEPYKGALVDDTAMNGVRFYCGPPLSANTTSLTSSVGSWGNWGNIYSCGRGAVVGFMLRVEALVGIDDETATNNIRVICSNLKEPFNYIEGDGLGFGAWRAAVKCGPREAVCGLQTQVQPDRGLVLDDTAMNNLSSECCPAPDHIEFAE